jgi:hypothetical protein
LFKNILLQNRKCQKWRKTSFIILESFKGPFSSLFEATSCDRYFSYYTFEISEVWKITISMLNNYWF